LTVTSATTTASTAVSAAIAARSRRRAARTVVTGVCHLIFPSSGCMAGAAALRAPFY